ncbi:hypothetical protein C8Q75DRAFT_732021 [Abortiporus biennis]|nr:hypothetical protein C8Q75DRAFT_732021 [Abortiporus biennis]
MISVLSLTPPSHLMLEQVLHHQALPFVLPDLSYPDLHSPYHHPYAYPPKHAHQPLPEHDQQEHDLDRQHTHSPTLSPPLSSPDSVSYRSTYNYDHRPSYDSSAPTPENMYEQPRSDDPSNNPYHNEPDYSSRQGPLPAILTGDSLLARAPYSPSPLSSPSEVNPRSAYSTSDVQQQFPQHQRFRDQAAAAAALDRYSFPQQNQQNQMLDRRMSEPIIRSLYHQHAADSFAYSGSASNASTVVPPTPHTSSPRPSSSSYSSSYPSSTFSHQRIGSGTSIGSGSGDSGSWGMRQKLPEGDERQPIYGSDILTREEESLMAKEEGDEEFEEGSPGSGGKKDKKTYSFVSLPGNTVKKRPRRRYDEIERLYQCNFPNCTKAYGTLNHLNAHVTMQKHGSKRSPNEFKELRKQWRQAKKEHDEAERERERASRTMSAIHAHHSHAHHPYELRGAEGHLRGDGLVARHVPRRRISLVDPYPPPHAFPTHQMHSPPSQLPYGYSTTQNLNSGVLDNSATNVPRYLVESTGVPSPELRYPPPPQQQQQLEPEVGHGGVGVEMPSYFRQPQPQPPSQTPIEHLSSAGVWHTSDMRHGQAGLRSYLPPSSSPPQSQYLPHPNNQQPEEELEEPLLTSHVSLGQNRLSPTSTLLTPLPGYQPEVEHPHFQSDGGGVMGGMGRYHHDNGGYGTERDDGY